MVIYLNLFTLVYAPTFCTVCSYLRCNHALRPFSFSTFTWLSVYCSKSAKKLIPLSMILGLYVGRTARRFFLQFNLIPWPHRIAMMLSTYIHTNRADDGALLMRRTIIRYVNVAIVMSLTVICKQVKRRFPTINHLTQAGKCFWLFTDWSVKTLVFFIKRYLRITHRTEVPQGVILWHELTVLLQNYHMTEPVQSRGDFDRVFLGYNHYS